MQRSNQDRSMPKKSGSVEFATWVALAFGAVAVGIVAVCSRLCGF